MHSNRDTIYISVVDHLSLFQDNFCWVCDLVHHKTKGNFSYCPNFIRFLVCILSFWGVLSCGILLLCLWFF